MAAAATSFSLRPCCGLPSNGSKPHIYSLTSHSSSPPYFSPFHRSNIDLSIRHRTSPVRAVTVGSDRVESASIPNSGDVKRYYFLVANAKFMLDEEEHFREQMFEKRRLYEERNKEQDFWLVVEPKFLHKFPNVTKRLKRPAVALVSTDAKWITFMKLRLDRVLSESFESDNFVEAMASDPVEIKFDKPGKWVAPYPKYESNWWETFSPKRTSKVEG